MQTEKTRHTATRTFAVAAILAFGLAGCGTSATSTDVVPTSAKTTVDCAAHEGAAGEDAEEQAASGDTSLNMTASPGVGADGCKDTHQSGQMPTTGGEGSEGNEGGNG